MELDNTNQYNIYQYEDMEVNIKSINQCLAYFGGCDAYTGEPLDLMDSSKWGLEYVYPPIFNNKLQIIQNLVPCNVTTVSFYDEYTLSWFQEQDFYDAERFLKICNWMAMSSSLSYMNKYNYVPLEQLKYIDTFDNNSSLNKFDIMKPNYKKETMYYSNRLNRKLFCDQVYNAFISDIEDELIKNWLDDKNVSMTSTHRILDRCGDYILNGELDYKGNCKYKQHEIAASNVSSEYLDLMDYDRKNIIPEYRV